MPVKVKKVDGYRVSTPGGVKAKSTTKAKAEAQKRIIEAADKKKHNSAPHGKFVDKRAKKFGVDL